MMLKLPRRLDHAIARRYPNLYVVLWYWGLVRNEPPATFGIEEPPARVIGCCTDGSACQLHCGSRPCSRECPVCRRLAWTPSVPCPACPDARRYR